MEYLDTSTIVGYRQTAAPRYGRDAYGYGSKIPASHMVQINDRRWRRVYVICYSNAGTAYVVIKRIPHYLPSYLTGVDLQRIASENNGGAK